MDTWCLCRNDILQRCNSCYYNRANITYFINENVNTDILSSLIDIITISRCRFNLYFDRLKSTDSRTRIQFHQLIMQHKKSLDSNKPVKSADFLNINIKNLESNLCISINDKIIGNSLRLIKTIIKTLEVDIIIAVCSYYKIDECHMVNLIARSFHGSANDKLIVCLYDLYIRTRQLPIFRLCSHQPSGYVNQSREREHYLDLPTFKLPKYINYQHDLSPEHEKFKITLSDSYKYRKGYANKKEQYIMIMEIALVISFLPPYVILWILDNLQGNYMTHIEKITLIQKVWDFKNVKSEN